MELNMARNLKSELIKLGNQIPTLREHLFPVLEKIKDTKVAASRDSPLGDHFKEGMSLFAESVQGKVKVLGLRQGSRIKDVYLKVLEDRYFVLGVVHEGRDTHFRPTGKEMEMEIIFELIDRNYMQLTCKYGTGSGVKRKFIISTVTPLQVAEIALDHIEASLERS